MAVLIPINRGVDDTGIFDLQTTLEGVTYTLEFRWNERCEAWFMSVWDVERVVPYALGVRLVADFWLSKYTVDRQPSGAFILVDTASPEGQGIDPGFDDLGSRHLLHYETLAELLAASE